MIFCIDRVQAQEDKTKNDRAGVMSSVFTCKHVTIEHWRCWCCLLQVQQCWCGNRCVVQTTLTPTHHVRLYSSVVQQQVSTLRRDSAPSTCLRPTWER